MKTIPMRFLILTFFVFIIFNLSAQVTKVTPYLVTYSGDKFVGQHLTYEFPSTEQSYFDLDGKTFDSPEVDYFQNSHGYFVNLSKIHGDKAERYAIRIKSGNVNLFEEVEMEVYAKEELLTGADGEKDANEMLATWKSFQYFSKSDGHVKPASYRNLKKELADNAISLREMKVYRNYRFLQVAMILAGASLITYDIAQQNGGAVRFDPMIATGIVIGGSSYLLGSAKENSKWLAVDAYNAEKRE